QLLHNLLKNGFEAVAGIDNATVTVCTRNVPAGIAPAVQLEVVDNGPGFDEEILGRVFEPYVTNKTKGTGLGLAIVRKLVEEHGGRLDASNDAPRGARVTILLPVNTAHPLAIVPAGAQSNMRGST